MYAICHSYFSLRYGTLSPKELANYAVEQGYKTLVLTDINNTSTAFEFLEACAKAGIKALLGIEFRDTENRHLYTGIAKNVEGWRNLCAMLTQSSLSGEALPAIAPPLQDCILVYRSTPKPLADFAEHEYYGISLSEIGGMFSSPLKQHADRLIAWPVWTYRDRNGYRVHKLLRCIDLNTVHTKLGTTDIAPDNEYILPADALRQTFDRYPELISRGEALWDSCEIKLASGFEHVNKKTFTNSIAGDYDLLCKLAREGCRRRYGNAHARAYSRTEKELQVIFKLGFAAYFLITWDIVRYARSAGYHHVGRGSGANSIVAYNLGITDVDPLELDLYFERFINPHRTSPPDFDIDFSWSERDDVTDYIFKRHGTEHTALLATYNTFKGRSIIRELGKVFGLPKNDIDIIVEEPLASDRHHPWAKHIFRYGGLIEKFPNYLSIHAGGILISEKPLNYHTALQMMPKGFPITHFDMYGAEDLGYHKYDVLSQRGLGHIKDAVDIVKRNKRQSLDVHDITKIKEDPKVRAQLHSGHCIGCFYIESPAMRGLLHKLRCDNYVHLVAASSIIRPGVAQSGMMREYIERFHHPEKIQYLHPVFEKNLKETYGVMVYQEDVMKIVHHFAGLDLDESDVLRRIMTGKKKSSDTFRRLQEKYFANCKARGYSDALTQEVWRQIESFSGYSFCKAHSASFAVESFQSLYLKTYYPKEFMVAVINNFGGFYNTELYVHEARMCGAIIHAPCVNRSTYLTTIYGDDIFIGLVHIQNLEQNVASRIVDERITNGPYRSLEDFVQRIDISKEQLEILIRINAFRFTRMNKYELMWEKNMVHNPQIKYSINGNFFPDTAEQYALPKLEEGEYEQAFDEIELLGFPLRSPFDLLADPVSEDILAQDMPRFEGNMVTMLGYYVTRKWVTTKNNKLMSFGTWVDREGNFFDTTHFPPSLEAYPFKGKGVYKIKGRIVDDFGFKSMEAHFMERLPYRKDGRY